MTPRLAHDRGHANHGWLNTFHTFSFADYRDPAHMGFSVLRVLNDDRVAAGRGFGRHGHRDMEIVSYVLEGALKHQDSMGNGSVIVPGDVQRMSAGTGVQHSEQNASASEPVHFLQIWILPDRAGHAPGYEQKRFEREAKLHKLCLVASGDGREGSVSLHQDVSLYAAILAGDGAVSHALARNRVAWIHVATGQVNVNGVRFGEGDAVAVTEGTIRLDGGEGAEVLVFDLPGRG